jgi:hypothetical protein
MDDETELDDELDPSEVRSDTAAEVSCPYCGEGVTILLDPGGGQYQEYVEDCEVCCRPWNVRVVYGGFGDATVTLEPT